MKDCRNECDTIRTTSSSTTTSRNTTTPSTSSSSIHTEPGVSQFRQLELNALRNAYARLFDSMTANVAWYLQELIEWGMDVEVIIHAIKETGWARKPTPWYMKAILRRYQAEGIRTMEQLQHNQAEREVRVEDEREWWQM